MYQDLFLLNVKGFQPLSERNKPQAEGKVNSRLYSRTQEKKFSLSFLLIDD